MPNTIQVVNPHQNGQVLNSLPQDRPTPRAAEKPPERPETASNNHPERVEVRNSTTPRKAEANPPEENQSRENEAKENPTPQEVQNNQGNKQLGKTLDIMA